MMMPNPDRCALRREESEMKFWICKVLIVAVLFVCTLVWWWDYNKFLTFLMCFILILPKPKVVKKSTGHS